MIIIRPLLLFLGFIFQYIPFLQFFGVAILFFTYFALIRNRNTHIKIMKQVYEANNWQFPDIKEEVANFWFAMYIISIIVMSLFYSFLAKKLINIPFEEWQSISIPNWYFYVFFGFFILSWVSYATMINRIVKDQWQLQESEISHNIVKNRFIKLRNGNTAMLLRIITLDIYEWLLLFFLIRETNMHYIEDGTATGKFAIPVSSGDLKKTDIEPIQDIKVKEKTLEPAKTKALKERKEENLDEIYNELIKKIKGMDDKEKYSTIFADVTIIKNKEISKQILNKLLEEGYITKEEFNKLMEFI